MAKNVGEYDELRIKLRLIQLRDKGETIVVGNKSIKIESVGLEDEFKSLPDNLDLSKLTDPQIEILANEVGAGKSRASYKADVNINGEGFSVKSHRSAPPAIVNHTPRWGWFRICEEIGVNIKKLDEIVEKYFELRYNKVIGEDIKNSDTRSPFAEHKEYLRPILNYFLFKGSGSEKSKYPAKFVLDCENPLDVSTWVIMDESNYLDKYWNNLIFSMRNKGFEAFPYRRACDQWKQPLSEPWAKIFENNYKGSLHVRVG